MTWEVAIHFFLRPQVELVTLHLHSIAVGPELACTYAKQNVLDLGVLAVDVVGVAGCNQRNTHAISNLDCTRHLLALDFELVVHDLDKEPITEHAIEPLGNFDCFLDRGVGVVTLEDRTGEFAGDAATEANDPFAVGFENLLVDSRLEVKSLQARRGCQSNKVFEAGLVFGKKRQVEGSFLGGCGISFETAPGRNVGFIAENWVDAKFFRFAIKLERAVQIAVVRNGQRSHAVRFGPLQQFIDRARAVEQTVVTVAMQMRERTWRVGGHSEQWRWRCGRARPCAR